MTHSFTPNDANAQLATAASLDAGVEIAGRPWLREPAEDRPEERMAPGRPRERARIGLVSNGGTPGSPRAGW